MLDTLHLLGDVTLLERQISLSLSLSLSLSEGELAFYILSLILIVICGHYIFTINGSLILEEKTKPVQKFQN